MELIDSHCHLTSLTHDSLEAILARAHGAAVTRMVSIGASDGLDSAPAAVALAERYPSVWASVGIHPHDAGKTREVETLAALAKHPRVVAIGETGLDFFRDWAPVEAQYDLFERTIAFAKAMQKPLIIHSRSAGQECFETLQRCGARDVGGVFHCYAEDSEFAKRLVDLNFIVSFPGSLTFKSAEALRDTARAIPLEQIMLETDAPYMAPEPFRGKPSEPAHVRTIAERMALVKGCAVEEIAAVTTATAMRFFGME